jgi:thymidylate synthase
VYLSITGRNGNQTYRRALESVLRQGERVSPKGKPTLEVQAITTILEPRERILTVPGRAANPFFNVAENLAIIAGLENQRDWFLQFNKQYVEVAHDKPTDKASWGFYGTRLRRWRYLFDHTPKEEMSTNEEVYVDQLQDITKKLELDKFSRQAVASLWNPHLDNQGGHKDYPCNWGVMFKVREWQAETFGPAGMKYPVKTQLHMTVVNRSNDIHWGLYGVNLNQWSFIQEVIAAVLGVEIGHQIHLSDSLHLYLDEPWATITHNMLEEKSNGFDVYQHTKPIPMFTQQVTWEEIDDALNKFFGLWNKAEGGNPIWIGDLNHWPFLDDAWNFLMAYKHRKNPESSFHLLNDVKDSALWVAGVEYLLRKPAYLEKITPENIQTEINRRFSSFKFRQAGVMKYILSSNIFGPEANERVLRHVTQVDAVT